jgi:hypothetical protein
VILRFIIFAGLVLGWNVDGRWPELRAADASSIRFSRDVLPILTDNCFACHGPDEQERKARLRLDLKADALDANRHGEHPIKAGSADESLVYQRISATEPEDVMPPPKSGKVLSPEQIGIIRDWINGGAEWEEHWAFAAPERPEPPEIQDADWARNPIDHFVAARLEREGMSPSPEADKTTLIRRAALDLTGLPPTPKEVDAYLTDESPEAYERLVDRLLASPAYGEHMAHYWMDAARYADSHGYHIDAERSMWKWRDWVVEAYNRNLPFDQFTIDQLAGDLVPEPTEEQKVASGYIRANMSTGEGGAIVEEYQAKYTFDRLETTSTIWLGLTMTCARCHTHKYDPITNTEYYGLYAFFNNLDESVMDGNIPHPDPYMKLPTAEQSERQAWLKDRIKTDQERLDAADPVLDAGQAEWERNWRDVLTESVIDLIPLQVESTRGVASRVADGKGSAEGWRDHRTVEVALTPGPLSALRLELNPAMSSGNGPDDLGDLRLTGLEAEWHQPGEEGSKAEPRKLKFKRGYAASWAKDREPGKALDDDVDSGWRPEKWNGSQSAVFVLENVVDIPQEAEGRVRLQFAASGEVTGLGQPRVSAVSGHLAARRLHPPKPPTWHVLGPFKSPGVEAGLDKEYDPERTIDLTKRYPGVREEIKWEEKSDIEDGKPYLLVNELHGVHGVYYLHRVYELDKPGRAELTLRADDVFKIWVNGELLGERRQKEKLGEGPLRLNVGLEKGTNNVLVKVVNLQGACRFTFNQEVPEMAQPETEIAALFLLGPDLSGDDKAKLRSFYRRARSPEWKTLSDQVALYREENDAIEQAIVTTLVAKERSEMRETFLLTRGEYDKPAEKVAPGVPAILPELPEDAPTNRLGFAQWLLDPAHPLTARVTVNRYWQQFFGTGLVKTAEDFGVQGERPSHPELLDWLATEYVRSGWDTKHLLRLIVTSATYRQSSKATPELLASDPENRLLARGPRFRVDGEVVRDTALAVSGLLVDELGGRSVKPYEPPGLWEAVSFNNSQKYVQDLGEANYRRSLYTHWKRQSPPPNMLLFDAPTREYCVVRRPRTNTPLQALALLNDPQFVEASRAFAQRILLEGGDTVESRVAYAFRLATARLPDENETGALKRLLSEQLGEFERDRTAVESLLAVGQFEADPALDQVELAAWTTIATVILNLDETVTKS